ncbi:zinc finger protein 618-like [Siniperca chuatsi]|uniref:zinc finger protein 618-like n=1 Tax=Siniperca chuatsi TaxID=119488 RepID=UPI001CE1C680|nr:zinc finger protein 618-like [Siniperca chuatsi]
MCEPILSFIFRQARISRLNSLHQLRGPLVFRGSRMEAKKIREKIKKGELKTKIKQGQKSSVWERFSLVLNHDESSAGYVICNSCEALYVYDSHITGTSNMVHHVCAKARSQPGQTNTCFVRRDSKRVTLPLDVKSKLVDDCVDMCCLDMRPFDIFTGKGFLQVAQTLINIGAKHGAVDAEAIVPNRQTVCDRAKQQAAADKEQLSEVIHKVMEDGGIAVTTNMWTDEFNKRAYTVLTCHYISEKWHPESRILATVECDSHLKETSQSIHDQITNVLMNYGIGLLADKIVFVSNPDPYIKAALETYQWMPCSAHILNTVLRDTFSENNAPEGIKDVVEMLDNCKSLVTFLKRTGAVASLAHTVIQECEFRWNSKVHMLESILKQYSDIRKLLEDRYQLHRMVGIFQDKLMHLIEFLTLFKLAINELEGERYPTIHTVLLWFLKLKKHCEPKFGDPSYIVLLRARASSLLEETLVLTPTHKVATFLCPRFKSLKMLSPEDRQEVMRQVRALINEEPSVSQNAGTSVTDASSAAGQGGHDSGRAKKQKVDFTEWEDERPKLMDEVEEYCSTNFLFEESEENLLSFWEKQDRSFPRLQHLARRILCIPATSAVSERSLSAAGCNSIIEARRNRLNPGTVDAILYLHSAKKKYK